MAQNKAAPKAPGKSTRTISIRLLRKDRSVETALRDIDALDEHPSASGRLFYDQSYGTPPSWLGFVNEFVAEAPLVLQNQSSSAILFLEVAAPDATVRTVALAFGGGHHALHDNAFERNFGLKVALNSIARESLKSLDTATLEATSIQKRVQASRKSDLGDFGIDVEHDLLRLAGGIPTDTTFANSLTGRDALTLNARISPTTIAAKCEQAIELFEAKDYLKDYAFIDQVVPVRETDVIETLDQLVFAQIQALLVGQPSDLHITIPEIIDPEQMHEIGYYGTGFKQGTKNGFGELAIEDYIDELSAGHPEQIQTFDDVKGSHEIRVVVDGHGEKQHRRRIYDCFVFETNHEGCTFVLFAGDWYRIDDDFYASVDADFQKLLSKTPILASTTAVNEQKLIADLDLDPDLLKLDQVKVSPSGATGANIEPCDFLSRKKEFIHLKDGHGSAPISHLWNQGVVSAESFRRDEIFRKVMRDKAIERQKASGKSGFEKLLPDGRSKPVAADYKIIYGIMRHRYQNSGKLGLPFFSKVSLRAAANRLDLMGFPVEVHLIEKQ